jgi:UDP-GlcNAc:undecaprenyl-phosphate GlcNAc-1-phosphate transferase
VVALAALISAAVVTPLAMWVAPRLGLVDRPGPLKVNLHPVPYLGGLGVAAGLVWGIGASRPMLLLPVGAALTLGLLDDAVGLPPVTRIVGEIAVGIAVGVTLPAWEQRVAVIVLSIVATVVLCNGVNMIDGLDGLAGGVTVMSAMGFYVVLHGDGPAVAIALAAGAVAFLAFNRPPARVYLGDGGAYLIGTALAILFVIACHQRSGPSVGAAILLVGYPLVELVFAIVRRLARRQPLTAGDRDHIYDQLLARGASAPVATLSCVVGQAALTASAIVVATRSTVVSLLVAVGWGALIVAVGMLTGLLTARASER